MAGGSPRPWLEQAAQCLLAEDRPGRLLHTAEGQSEGVLLRVRKRSTRSKAGFASLHNSPNQFVPTGDQQQSNGRFVVHGDNLLNQGQYDTARVDTSLGAFVFGIHADG